MDANIIGYFFFGIGIGLFIGRMAGKKEANQTWEAWKHQQEWLAYKREQEK